MTLLTAFAAILTVGQEPTPQDPAVRTYTDAELGLSFTYPATWVSMAPEIPKGKKPKKPEVGTVTFSIPGASGSAPSELTIVHASFSGAPEKWQQIQADTNRNLKREVERQWQQEILGVPLLLTRIGYTKDGTATTTLTGLLYNAAASKLLFRLSGPAASFDAAQFEFTKAMETLRTTDNTLPTVQEPDKPVAPPPGPPKPDSKHPLFVKPKVQPKVAPVKLEVTFGGRKMWLRVPEGCTLEKFENDTATLRIAGVKAPVTAKFYAASTSPRPTDELMTVANVTLSEFKTVALRQDTPGTPNKAGNPLLAIWRKGENATGPYAAVDAVLVAGDYYLMFSSRPTASDGFASERKAIQAVLDAVGLEPAP